MNGRFGLWVPLTKPETGRRIRRTRLDLAMSAGDRRTLGGFCLYARVGRETNQNGSIF